MNNTIQTMISIDNGHEVPGRIDIEQETETIYSNIATKPDQRWEQVDDNGHFHAFSADGKLPTLVPKTRHVDCDGIHTYPMDDCDGYDVTDYYCRICNAEIEPKYVSDPGPWIVPTGKSWTVIVEQHVGPQAEVSVRATVGDAVMFGVAVATRLDWADGRSTAHLVGIGALGNRARQRATVGDAG
jgi:hypothetical protein